MLDDYTVKHKIASGDYSKVKLVQDRQGKYYSAKLMYYTNEQSKIYVTSLLTNELKSLRLLTGSKTIQIIAASFEGKHLAKRQTKLCVYLLSTFYTLGPLTNVVPLRPSESACRYFFTKAISALDSIHSQGVIHLNIKLENLLIDNDMSIRFCGFSMSSISENRKIRRHSLYSAPEIVGFKNCNGKKIDIFALGVLIFMLLCGSPPFLRASQTDTHYKLLQSKNPAFWNLFPRVSNDFKELILGMLKDNPEERYDLDTIKQHRWTKAEYSQEEIDVLHRKLLKSLEL